MSKNIKTSAANLERIARINNLNANTRLLNAQAAHLEATTAKVGK